MQALKSNTDKFLKLKHLKINHATKKMVNSQLFSLLLGQNHSAELLGGTTQ